MIIHVFSNSMIFPCMELIFVIIQVFHDFQSLWEPCVYMGESSKSWTLEIQNLQMLKFKIKWLTTLNKLKIYVKGHIKIFLIQHIDLKMFTHVYRTNGNELWYEPRHEIFNNVVCATSKGSDQPAHTRSLIRAFASHLNTLWILRYWRYTIWSF